jgi:hypothetical protein
MSPPRSALPLPRYVRRKPLKGGEWGYFFDVPSTLLKAGCPVHREVLGIDYAKAVERAEKMLLPLLDEWQGRRRGGDKDADQGSPTSIAVTGTLDWVFAEYRADRRFTKLDAKTKRNHEVGFRMVGGYVLKDGRRLGVVRLTVITTAVVDELYGKLLFVREKDNDGNEVERERRTTVNHAMKSCRRAWHVAARRNPGKLPQVNPFAAMGLEASDRETPTATFAELQAFRVKAIEKGYPSLATAALIGWEWLQREIDIFATFEVGHYRPKEHPNAVRVVHEKTGEENWIPLLDDKSVPFFPDLMAELDALPDRRRACKGVRLPGCPSAIHRSRFHRNGRDCIERLRNPARRQVCRGARLRGRPSASRERSQPSQRAFESASTVGSSMVIVDALDQTAAGFYAAHGFVRLPDSLRLVIPMRQAGAEPKG